MDNKGNQNKNGKNPRGQNYAVLIMTMLFTLLCVAMMHNLWQGSRTHKMPYSEFNQMLKDHEVESVVIGNGKIQITPKEDYHASARVCASDCSDVRHFQYDDEAHGRRRRHHGCRQEQC